MEDQALTTLYSILVQTTDKWPDRPAYGAPPMMGRSYHPSGVEYTYTETLDSVNELRNMYMEAGYGHGHRVALLLEQRPELFFHLYALNAIGCSIVPINPDYKLDELIYQIDHSEVELVIGIRERLTELERATSFTTKRPSVVEFERFPKKFPIAKTPPPLEGDPGPETEAALLYTSGTTGKPKGCILTNLYFYTYGSWYVNSGEMTTFRGGVERLYNPLPLHHANALAISASAMLLVGGCHISPDRFHARSFWKDMVECQITVIHYLGVIPNMLIKHPPVAEERGHQIRFGLGVGIDPARHREIEERFGFPFIEFWAMTETGRMVINNSEPRLIDTRAFGRTRPGLDVRVVDEDGNDLPDDSVGELLVRHTAKDPRKGFFSGYLKNPEATAEAWRGGWFHTGDLVKRDNTGMYYFIDRKKNIIRRAGENIAAAEVEEMLTMNDKVKHVAVISVPDDVREEEIFACIVTRDPTQADINLANELFNLCYDRLAYFKAPGWILFLDELPMTTTQKIQKTNIFHDSIDPRAIPGVYDFRELKVRERI